jgi:hypothetical protein
MANLNSADILGVDWSRRARELLSGAGIKPSRPANGVSPTLILKVLERPKYISNSRIWADEASGPDLYEAIFRPKIDKKLHEANPYYWEY